MSTLCLVMGDYNPIFNQYGDRGVSEDASTLKNRFVGKIEDYSIFFGWSKEIIQTINEVIMDCSSDNWDGYGAQAIDFASYEETLRFIHFLPKTIPVPEIAVEPDGEVALEWYRSKNRVFSVSIGGKGSLTYAGLFGSNKAHGTEYFGDELPKTILDNIQRVFA